MAQYTVTEVSQNVRDWSSQQGGPMREYRVHLMPQDGTTPILNVEWSRKASSPAPTVGQQVQGELEDRGTHGKKLKVAPGMSGGGYGPRPEDPKRAARILRQHSQDMALQVIRLAFEQSLYHEAQPANTDELRSLIQRWADWFDKDAERAAQ